MAKKLTKAGPVEKELIDLINGSISSGLWEEVSEKELEDSNNSSIYLPYNYASKWDTTTTTKSRFVMDPAAKGG